MQHVLKKATFFRTFRNRMRKIQSALLAAPFLRDITVFTRFHVDVFRNTNSTIVLSMDSLKGKKLEGKKEHKFRFKALAEMYRIQWIGFVVSIFAFWLALSFPAISAAYSTGFAVSPTFGINTAAVTSISSNSFAPNSQDDVELINRIWTDTNAQQVLGVFSRKNQRCGEN